MSGFLLPLLAGTLTGILSAFGLGGGSLLLVWLTAFAGMEQQTAQGINLLYFLPAAALSLPAHVKNGYVDPHCVRAAVLPGLVCTALAAWAATAVDGALLRRLFGAFLLLMGLRELLSPKPKEE